MKTGIEEFEKDLQGWCFVAVQGSVADVLKVLKGMFKKRLAHHVAGVKILPSKKGTQAAHIEGERSLILLRMEKSTWTVLLVRVHYFSPEDGDFAVKVAQEASKTLTRKAAAAMSDDASGSFAEVFEKGKPTAQLSTEEGPEEFYAFFSDEGIYVPACFIALGDRGVPTLMTAKTAAVEQADYVGIVDA